MLKDQLDIPIRPDLHLLVYPHSKGAQCFEEGDAYEHGESKWQLQEGREYEYEFVDDNEDPAKACFEDKPGIVFPRRKKSEGTIRTGINVGTLALVVIDTDERKNWNVELEIQSIKTSYRQDYQKMLTDIAGYYAELVMMHGSPVSQKIEVDNDATSQALYQKFVFVKGIVDSETFDEAIQLVIQNPVRTWEETTVLRHSDNVRRLNRKALRQVVSRTDRVPCTMVAGLTSLPRRLEVPYKSDSTDTSENQFIKFVLTQFYSFCTDIASKRKADAVLKKEAEIIGNYLLRYLNNSFFKSISLPQHLNLNSPILQRKEGYREILQAWLIFDLAAKLVWKGGDNVYEAGKRNVAALYEYWLYFKLLEIICSIFNISPESKRALVEKEDDDLNLRIRQGKQVMVEGVDDSGTRKLNVRFYYNRTYVYRKDIHRDGSWTLPMRPDYTLTLWPGNITEEKAEEEDLIVHIHFDAKYRIDKVILNNTDSNEEIEDELSFEKELEESGEYEIGKFKRADILKMHAYKDAIRRTSGAYILYPGEKPSRSEGYHEIIPGLGAFCISPGKESDQVEALKQFIIEVKEHMMYRTSQREQMAFQSYSIYKNEPSNDEKLLAVLPEASGENRGFRPEETFVLVGYCADYNKNFIVNKKLYNTRTGHRSGAIDLDQLIKAQYILLWNKTGWTSFQKKRRNGVKVFSAKDLVNMGYTTSKMEGLINKGYSRAMAISGVTLNYFYTTIDFDYRAVASEFANMKWDTNKIEKRIKRKPKLMKLSELLEFSE